MLSISDILIGNNEMNSFEELIAYVKLQARQGELFIQMDVRPPFADTPEDWEQQVEAAFTSASNVE